MFWSVWLPLSDRDRKLTCDLCERNVYCAYFGGCRENSHYVWNSHKVNRSEKPSRQSCSFIKNVDWLTHNNWAKWRPIYGFILRRHLKRCMLLCVTWLENNLKKSRKFSRRELRSCRSLVHPLGTTSKCLKVPLTSVQTITSVTLQTQTGISSHRTTNEKTQEMGENILVWTDKNPKTSWRCWMTLRTLHSVKKISEILSCLFWHFANWHNFSISTWSEVDEV